MRVRELLSSDDDQPDRLAPLTDRGPGEEPGSMPISYAIDTPRGVVFTRATGILTDDELVAHKRAFLGDPAFQPGMVELSDVRHVQRLEVTPRGVGRLVAQDQADAVRLRGYRLAIVASQDVVFGMARMYGTRTETNVVSVSVLRDIEEARLWLGLSPQAP